MINVENFIIFSDSHFLKHENMSIHLDDGNLTSWVKLQLYLVAYIFSYATKHNVKTIIHNGDLFEQKDRIPQDLYNKVWSFLREISKGFDLILNIGNHDFTLIYDRFEGSGLMPFSSFAYIPSCVKEMTHNRTFMRIIPYGLATETTITKPNKKSIDNYILILHEEIPGIAFGDSGYRSKRKDISISKLKEWNVVLNGHIHKPQQIHNIYCIGSVIPVDWGESSDQKRFIHYQNGSIISIELPHQKYIRLEGDLENAKQIIGNDTINYYRIKTTLDKINDDIFKRFNVSYDLIKEEQQKVRIKKDLTILDEAILYSKENNKDLNEDQLIHVAKDLVR